MGGLGGDRIKKAERRPKRYNVITKTGIFFGMALVALSFLPFEPSTQNLVRLGGIAVSGAFAIARASMVVAVDQARYNARTTMGSAPRLEQRPPEK